MSSCRRTTPQGARRLVDDLARGRFVRRHLEVRRKCHRLLTHLGRTVPCEHHHRQRRWCWHHWWPHRRHCRRRQDPMWKGRIGRRRHGRCSWSHNRPCRSYWRAEFGLFLSTCWALYGFQPVSHCSHVFLQTIHRFEELIHHLFHLLSTFGFSLCTFLGDLTQTSIKSPL